MLKILNVIDIFSADLMQDHARLLETEENVETLQHQKANYASRAKGLQDYRLFVLAAVGSGQHTQSDSFIIHTSPIVPEGQAITEVTTLGRTIPVWWKCSGDLRQRQQGGH